MTRRRVLVGTCLALLAACSRSDTPVKADPDTPGTLPSSALRLARAGGAARVYGTPDLAALEWTPADRLPAVQAVVGTGPEQRLVFVHDAKRNLIALELGTGAVRGILTNVRDAVVGPDGSLFAIDTGGTVVRVARRNPVRYRSRLAARPGSLSATLDGRLLAFGTKGALSIVSPTDSIRTIRMPSGPVAVTVWGDMVAVAADTAAVVYDPTERREPQTIDVENGTALVFSPSGHRLYIAESDDRIAEVDRFGLGVMRRIELPGTARALRTDFYGRWLLARPVTGDSLWVVDLDGGKVAATIASAWDDDLPAIAGAGTLLVRRGDDIVALDLAAGGLVESGRVGGGGADFWLPVAWSPVRRAPPPTAIGADGDSSAADTATSDTAGADTERLYLQVSSSQNPEWARELAEKLRGIGLPATALEPERAGEPYRVVVGPYRGRAAADEAGRKLGMPYFVIGAPGGSAR